MSTVTPSSARRIDSDAHRSRARHGVGTDVEVTSTINIFVKDSGLVASAGEACGAQLPLLAIAHERFCRAADAGFGLRDDSRVIDIWND